MKIEIVLIFWSIVFLQNNSKSQNSLKFNIFYYFCDLKLRKNNFINLLFLFDNIIEFISTSSIHYYNLKN